jgi:hypothetical protein
LRRVGKTGKQPQLREFNGAVLLREKDYSPQTRATV